MNKIFKVIFSKAKGCYVVVSELAKSAGKGTSASHIQRGYKLTLAAAVLSMMMGMVPAGAAASVDLDHGGSASYDSHGNLVVGNAGTVAEGTKQAGEHNTTIGTDSDTLRKVAEGDTKGQPMDTDGHTKLVEGEGQAHDLDEYRSTEAGGSTAVGYDNHNEGDRSTAIGNHAIIANKPVTYYVDADGNKTASPDNAVWYKDTSGKPTKVPQVFRDAGGNTTATPQYVHTYTEKDTATGKDVTKTEITSDATKADKDSAGNPVYNYKKEDNKEKLYTVTLYQAASNSIAAGTDVTANGSNAVAVGNGSTADNSAVAVGNSSTADNSAVAIGDTAIAVENGVAIGKGTKASVEGSIALGKGSEASRDGGIAGWDPKTGTASTKTDAAWKSGEGALSIGNSGASRQITNVAAGSEDSDAVNLAQLKNAMTHYYSVKTTSDTDAAGNNNYLNDGATGNNALAAGVSAKATGENAVAIGYKAQADGYGATVIGQYAKATGQYATAFGGLQTKDRNNNNIITYTNTASGASSTAFGQGAQAKGAASLAFGHNTVAGGDDGSGQQSVAFGEDTQALGGRSLAFGEKTIAKYNDSVAFGNDTRASSTGATAFGNRTRALSSYSTAWGNATVAADEESTAWGTDTIAGAKLDANGAVTNIYTYKNNPDDKNEQAKTATEQMDVHGNLAYIQLNGKTAGIKQMKIDSGDELHDYVVLAGKDGNTYVRDYQGSLWKVNVAADGTVTVDTTAGTKGKVYNGQKKTSLAKTTVDGSEVDINPDNVLTKAHEGTNGYTIDGYANATAFGYSTEASGDNATAFGNDTVAAAAAATAFGESSVANGEASVAFGIKSEADGKNSMAGLGGKAYADNTIALGQNASAHVDGAIAIGNTAYDQATNGVALGTRASIVPHGSETISDATAIGTDTKVMGSRSTAIGYKASAMNDDTVVLGNNIISQAEHSTIIGFDGGISSGTYNTVVGADSGVSGNYNTSIGYKNNIVQSSDSLVLGSNSKVNGGSQLVAIGYNVTTQTTQAGSDSLALGFNNAAQGSNNISIGTNSMTMDDITTAIGYHASAYGGNGATAIGQYTTANGKNSVVLGSGKSADQQTSAIGENSVALGAAAKVVADSSLAIGDEAVTTGKQSIAIGYKAQAYVTKTNSQDDKANALAIGSEAGVSSANGMALGSSAKVSGENGTALGTSAAASGKDGAAIGTSANVWGEAGVALGRNTGAAEDSTAIGDGANAWKSHTMALGKGANGAVEYGIALGEGATVTNPYKQVENGNWVEDTEHAATGAVAIGRSALTNVEGGVALGQDSQSVTAKGVAGYDVLTKTASTAQSSTWVSTSGAVSVGDKAKGLTRQITNLAAGYEDTDAVNVAQLKAADAKHTIVTVGGQSVTADNTSVTGGNLDLKRTTATNGQETYDLSLDKNVTLGEQVENEGGKLTVNNVDKFKNYDKNGDPLPDTTVKEAVKIDGKTVSVVKHDGSDADNDQRQVVLGVDQDAGGYVALYDNTGKKPTYIYNAISDGITYLKDKDSYLTPEPTNPNDERASNEFNRLEYGDYRTSTIQFIATLDDGQKYAGDNYQAAETETKTVDGKTTKTVTKEEQNVLLKKLNERLDIQGGANKDKLTENNIGVNVDSTTGVMKVQLAQNLNLTGNGSVTMGNTTINNGGVTITTKDGDKVTNTISLTDNGLNNGGKTITNVANGTNPNDAVNVSQLNAAKTTVTSNDHSVTIDTTTDSTDNHKNYDLKIATATLSQDKTTGDNPVETGKVTVSNPKISVIENGETKQVDNPNAYVTGNSVADAINKSGFKLIASKSEGDVTGNAETLIHPGDTMTIDAGKNISLTQTNGKISIATKDKLVLGKDTSDGKDGQEGTIGLTGKDGIPGTDDKQGYSTTIIKTEKGQKGKDGKTGKENLGGTDITRIVYTDKDGSNPQTVATLSDGLKFAGDDISKTVDKKLNDTLQIRGDGTYNAATHKTNDDGNIKISSDAANGTIKVALSDKINLHQDGSLTVGGDKQDDSTDSKDPIVIKHFDDKTLDVITGVDQDGKSITSKEGKAGDYVTGLDNKDWDVSKPTYVSGRAATEDQLKKVSDAVNSAAATAGKHTVVTVNDKDSNNETKAEAGTGAFGDYAGADKGNLLIAAKDDNGQMTYNIKLNDQLAIGQKGEPGVAGKDGKVTVETKGGTTVVIGHDGQNGEDGKDGISVIGKDGQNGVSIIGSNGLDGKDGIDGKISIGTPGKDGQPGKDAVSISGQNGVGHIGLTGQKGEDGKDGVFTDLSTTLGTATLDPAKNEQSKSTNEVDKDDKSSRIQYQTTVTDKDGKTKTVITHEVATMDDGQKYAGDFGKGASVKLNKTVTIKGNVAAGKTKDDFVDGNIAVVANKSQNGEDGELLIKLNKDLTGLNSATYTTSTKNGDVTTTSTTVVDGTGLKIENGPSITNTGIDGGKHQITNVASGKDGKMYDTTVEGQENWNNAANIGDVTNIAKSAADGVQAKSGKNITVDDNNKVNLNDHITLGDAANKAKQVDIDGNGAKITAGDGDNKVTVDGSKGQIVAGGDNGVKIGNIAGGDSSLTIYDKDGKATNQTDKAGKYVTNLGNKTWNKDGSYVSGRAATEDQLHQVESNVNKQIADVNTKIDKVDKHHTEVTVNGGTPAKADGAYTDGNLQLKQTTGEDGQKVYDLKLNDQLKVGQKGDAGKAGKDGNVTVETKGGTTVVIGHDGKDGKDGRDGLFVTGKDGKDGKSGVSITGPNGVAGRDGVDGKVGIAGKDGRDAVSIAGRDGVGHIGLTGPKGADGKDGAFTDLSTILGQATLDPAKNVKGKDGDAKDEKASRIHYETTVATKDGEKTVSHEVATMDDGMKYGDDFGNTAKVKLNHQLDIVGDINSGKKDGDKKATKDDLSDGNIGIVATDTVYNDDGTVKENGKMTVKLAKDLKGLNSIESNSVTTGNTTINNGGLTINTGDANRNITVQDGNVNMGGNQIHHVAPGQAPDDAVNVSQLNATNYAVNKLDTRVNRVGANAAALAALHPLDFDPDDKWDFSAGYGHYKDANAAAVGAFYRPNEDTMFSVGGSFGGGENMVNAGVSVKLGQGNHVSTSRVAMAKEIKDLKKDVAALKAVVNQQSALIDKLTGVNAGELSGSDDLFPDVPANHWAYEYVTRLKQAGILTGYPDGNFAGDRMMTRYEFAAIVYRAIMAGAAANPSLNKDGTLDRLAKEFSGEMKYIRIDTIRKDRNGRPTIQRVRVIKEDEKEK